MVSLLHIDRVMLVDLGVRVPSHCIMKVVWSQPHTLKMSGGQNVGTYWWQYIHTAYLYGVLVL